MHKKESKGEQQHYAKATLFRIARIALLFVMNNKKMLSQLCVLNDCWDIIVPLVRSTGTIMSHNKTNRKLLFFTDTFSIRDPMAITLQKIKNNAKTTKKQNQTRKG